MEFLTDALKTVGIGAVFTIVTTFILSLLKKHKFEEYGVLAGRWVSRFARLKFGKTKWEKLEAALEMIVLRFAQGFKIGLDLDDNMEDEELTAEETTSEDVARTDKLES